MVFVTIGTSEPFDRLLRALPQLDGEELVVQAGESDLRPDGARCISYVPYEELVELIRAARVVVTHAGVGTIMTVLANGKRPVVMPRLARFGEAVDDHQLPLARRLAEDGFVTLAEDEAALADALAADQAPTNGRRNGTGRLARELREFLTEQLAARTA
jgi:UDP-N-acetylglucosamine transferase subunit ALG13